MVDITSTNISNYPGYRQFSIRNINMTANYLIHKVWFTNMKSCIIVLFDNLKWGGHGFDTQSFGNFGEHESSMVGVSSEVPMV